MAKHGAWGVLLVAALSFWILASQLERQPRMKAQELFAISLPAPIQVLLAGGDRFLAANIAVFRAMVVGGGPFDQETYRVLADIQQAGAQLNPAHEDNYYLSQAVLPWNGEVEADMDIQQRAKATRPWDYLPPFFLAFDRYWFLKDPLGGASSLRIAADRSGEKNRGALLAIAARWSEKGNDPRVAINMIRAMAANTRDRELKSHLEARIERLQGLALLQDAADKFRAQRGRLPVRLDELVGPGLLAALPRDPLGQGFALDTNGAPIVMPPSSTK